VIEEPIDHHWNFHPVNPLYTNLWTSILTEIDFLAARLQSLHVQLPKLSFEPDADTVSTHLPEAKTYLDHYNLSYLSEQASVRHYIGSVKCSGYTIACQYWLPTEPTGTAFVVHGYFDHAGLYGHLFQYLLDKNLVVVAFDLPGHGLSDGEQVSIASFDHYVEVFEEILAAANNHLPQPWHSIGQSTGGAIVLKHLLEETSNNHLFTHISLLAPLLHPRRWHSNRLVYLIAHRFLSRLKRRFLTNSGDPAFLAFLNSQDPLQARHIPLEWIGAMKRWTEEFHDLPISSYPLSIIQGDQDSTLDWRYNLKKLCDKLPQAKIHIIKDARHHLVNETDAIRTQVFEAMGFHDD
jgi:alpha-beta hydrolase superfamily lysophospholipase